MLSKNNYLSYGFHQNWQKKMLTFLSLFVIIIVLVSCTSGKTKTVMLTMEKPNNIGNTIENLENDGSVTRDEKFVYAIVNEWEDDKVVSNLCKSDFDGNHKVLLCKNINASYLNIMDNRIYYKNYNDNSAIYRIDKNGENNQKISDIRTAFLVAYENALYVIGGNNIYVMNGDGSDARKLSDEQVYKIYLYKDNIYFAHYAPKDWNNYIGKMNLNGENKEKICDYQGSLGWMSIYNDTIYYILQSAPHTLNKVSILGQNQTKIRDMEDYIPSTENINKNIFYYTTSKGSSFALGQTAIHQLNLETGEEKTRNVPIKNKSNGSYKTYSDFLIHDKIFRVENGKMFVMNSDGSNSRQWGG